MLGYLATMPLGAIFGWSGHPAMPAAPMAVYVAFYVVALPSFCLAGAWALIRPIEARLRRRKTVSRDQALPERGQPRRA